MSIVSSQWVDYKISKVSNPMPSIEVGDINGDDTLDVVVAHNVTADIVWYKNMNAGQSWESEKIDDDLKRAWLVRIADINGDGNNDIVATVHSYLNDRHTLWISSAQLLLS